MMKNLKQWKTSAIGIVSLASGFSYVFLSEEPDYKILGVLMLIGIGLVLAPDPTVSSFKRGIRNLSKGVFSKTNSDETDEEL